MFRLTYSHRWPRAASAAVRLLAAVILSTPCPGLAMDVIANDNSTVNPASTLETCNSQLPDYFLPPLALRDDTSSVKPAAAPFYGGERRLLLYGGGGD
jgi:hypothetical protein